MNPEVTDIFLCHNRADKAWVRKLGGRLEAETADGSATGRRIVVFFDEWDIEGGDNVVKKLGEALDKARFVAVVMSPEFFRSEWTAFEWTDVVADDPSGKNGKLLPLLRRDVSLDGKERIHYPAPFKALHRYDFRNRRTFEREFERLLRKVRGLAPQRGPALAARYSSGTPASGPDEALDSWLPDRVEDVLLGNLLEVRSMPLMVWSAKTEEPDGAAVWEKVPGAPPVMVRSKRLWTFANLEADGTGLRSLVDTGAIESSTVGSWLEDAEKRLWLVELLNKCLAKHLSKLALKKDRKGRFFFRPERDEKTGEVRDRTWQNGKDRERRVAARKTNAATGAEFWVHHAAVIKFQRFGSKFFMAVEPTYLFTSNGEIPLEGDTPGKLAVMWGGRQQNPDILRNLVFWAKTMARSAKEFQIETGGDPVVVSGLPAVAVANVGIEADHVRVAALLQAEDDELEQAAQDVEVVPGEEEHGEEGEAQHAGEPQ